MIAIFDNIDVYEIGIIVDDDWKECMLTIRYTEPINLTVIDSVFNNARMLSSSLSCSIGLGLARDLMHKHNVPRHSELWFMNHSYHPNDNR